MDRGAWQATVHGVTGVTHNVSTKPSPNLKDIKDLYAEDYIKHQERKLKMSERNEKLPYALGLEELVSLKRP